MLIQRQAGAVQTDESKKIRNGKKSLTKAENNLDVYGSVITAMLVKAKHLNKIVKKKKKERKTEKIK